MDHLARVTVQAFASVQLRRIPWAKLRTETAAVVAKDPSSTTKPSKKEPAREPVAKTKKFDPYSFGSVPIYQREGREGLIEKLSTVSQADYLRIKHNIQI